MQFDKEIFFYLGLLVAMLLITTVCYHFRHRIRKWLNTQKFKLSLNTLRTAIVDADKDKNRTDRKNIVVFNDVNEQFEPVQKRLLKFTAQNGKNNSNASMTKYRRKRGGTVLQKSKKKSVTLDRIKNIEEKSLYVTK